MLNNNCNPAVPQQLQPIDMEPEADQESEYYSQFKDLLTDGFGVRLLTHPTQFNIPAILARRKSIHVHHVMETVLWAFPLYVFGTIFSSAATKRLKTELCEATYLASYSEADEELADKRFKPRKLRQIQANLNDKITVAMLCDITTPDDPEHSNVFFKVMHKVEVSAGRRACAFNMRVWARRIQAWIKEARSKPEDPVLAIKAGVSQWINEQNRPAEEPAPPKPPAPPPMDPDLVPLSPPSGPEAGDLFLSSSSSDTENEPDHHDNDNKRKDPPGPFAGDHQSPPVQPWRVVQRSNSRPWRLQKPEVETVPFLDATLPTCVVPPGLPMVSMVLVATLHTRSELAHADPRFAVNFFEAPDDCGKAHVYPTSIFNILATNLRSVSDFQYAPSCVPVTGGKVTGEDLQRVFHIHCHFTHAIGVLCVHGMGEITIKSKFRPSRVVSFSHNHASAEAGFVVVLPGQTITMDADAKRAAWCLVGLGFTDTLSRIGLTMPVVQLENEAFQRSQLLEFSPTIPLDHSVVLLQFDVHGSAQPDRRLPPDIRKMLERVFYCDSVINQLSMDQARKRSPCLEAVTSLIPAVLSRLGTRHGSTSSVPEVYKQEGMSRTGKPHVLVCLGGPWAMVELRCGAFHGYFHARPGGFFVQDSWGCGDESNRQELTVTFSNIYKIGDRPGAWVFMSLS